MGFDFSSERLQQEAAYIGQLVVAEVLVPMSPRLFPGNEGTLTISCSDGDQMQNIMMRHWLQCSGRHCHHVIANNGLGLRIAPESSVAKPFESQMWLDDILLAIELKNLHAISIYGHWPCGVANNAELTMDEQLGLYSRAKEALLSLFREKSREIEILIGLHVDHGGAANPYKELYWFNRHRWGNFLAIDQGNERLGSSL